MSDKVSIIMPTYNCAQYIAQSISSVLAQTWTDWELLITDDASSDDTAQVVAQFRDARIRYLQSEQNRGPAAARNRALQCAGGRWVAFLDSDDLWAPQKLERQIAFMEAQGAKFSCTAYTQMDADGSPLHIGIIPPARTDYNKCIRLSNPIGNSTVMYDQAALGKFRVPEIKKRNDFALWLQILKHADCIGLNEFLCQYRRGRPGSISGNKFGLIKYHWQLYHDIEKLGLLKSCWGMACWALVKSTGIGLTQIKC